jgi:tetratricopeptide (TPR) repeat protein
MVGACSARSPKAPPPAPPPPTPQAEALYLAGRWTEALAALGDSTDPRAADLAGRCLMGLGRPEEAIGRFETAIRESEDPTAAIAARARLAHAYLEAERPREALAEARRVLSSPHGAASVPLAPFLLTAGSAAARAGQWEEAEDYVRRAMVESDAAVREAAPARLALLERRAFTVQLGLFATRAGAEALAARTGGEVLSAPPALFVVVRGRYESWADAREAAAGTDGLPLP